jgi:Protein of unknown function (DUF1499)
MKVTAILATIGVVSPLVSAFTTNRRDLLQRVVIATTTTGTATALVGISPSQAVLPACPPKSKNCLTTTWTAPSNAQASSGLADILNSYPQEGQNGVDLGGWKFVEDNLATRGTAKLEYTSGIGTFAKFFNGGKPFVDDMTIEITDTGLINIKSSSRIGESDLGVNQKRLQFLAAQARSKGWQAPDPTY